MKKELIDDIRSGFLIFLIALPLSLGIAIASSFPPIAGLIAAIIGGMITPGLGGSKLTIKGPAAGLIIVILGAVQELGQGDLSLGYRRCLAVGVVAGLLQILISKRKLSRLAYMVPPSVIHGMLAAIGVIIIAKQVHILLGVAPHGKTPLELIAEVPQSILSVNPRIALIGLTTICTIFLWPLIPNALTRKVPASLIALFFAMPMAIAWHLDTGDKYIFMHHLYELGPKYLVSVPQNIFQSLTFPDFRALQSLVTWKYVIMLTLIGSLESLLTVIAIDSLSPEKKASDLDRDLFSLGVGNLISSLIGGLPMISEVVRSKSNLDAGAKSGASNFFHGLFLLLALTLIPGVLHEVPLSALAAMLIITGFRLASPREFYKTYKIGSDQLTFFVITLVVTLATDLLIGVSTGLIFKFCLHLYRGLKLKYLIKTPVKVSESEDQTLICVEGPAIFTNSLHLGALIQHHLQNTQKPVVVNFSQAQIVDHTTLQRIKALAEQYTPERLKLIGLENLKGSSPHRLASRTQVSAEAPLNT
jgi:MFS superfamily sulfate permease-like transporter